MTCKKIKTVDKNKPKEKRPLESWDLGGERRCDKMREWEQCPTCGEHGVRIVSDNLSDEMYEAIHVGECPHCGWRGEIYFDMVYSSSVTDPEGWAASEGSTIAEIDAMIQETIDRMVTSYQAN